MKGKPDEWQPTRPWSGICPDCNGRRLLWPLGQNVTTGWEPWATFIHRNGKAGCPDE